MVIYSFTPPPRDNRSKYMRNVCIGNIALPNTHPGILKLIFLITVVLYLQGDPKLVNFWVFEIRGRGNIFGLFFSFDLESQFKDVIIL